MSNLSFSKKKIKVNYHFKVNLNYLLGEENIV